MEAKLAEFRKSHVQKQPFINRQQIVSRLSSIFSFSSTKSSEMKHKKEDDEEEEEAEEVGINWPILMIKFFVWLSLLIIFIRLEFGIIYLILSLFYFIWTNLSSHRRHSNQLSAYSVFNPNFEKVQGTFSAEDYDRQLRHGGSPFFTS